MSQDGHLGTNTGIVDQAAGLGCFEGCAGAFGLEVENSAREGEEAASAKLKGEEKAQSQTKSKKKMVQSPQ